VQTSTSNCSDVRGLVISGNISKGFDNQIFVNAKSQGEIHNVVISNNVCVADHNTRGIRIYAEGSLINGVVISGNILHVDTNECIYMQGSSGNLISNSSIFGNKTTGGTYGLRILYCDVMDTSGNIYIDYSSNAFFESNSTNYITNDLASIDNASEITTSVTIASGVVTAQRNTRFLSVDTEAAAASDNLDTINGGYAGQIIVVKTQIDSRDVTCTSSGNLRLSVGSTVVLGNTLDTLTLMFNGGQWMQIGASDNSA